MEKALLETKEEDEELAELMACLNNYPSSKEDYIQVEPLPMQNPKVKVNTPLIVQPPELKLKSAPKHLRYAFLGDCNTHLVIISTLLPPL